MLSFTCARCAARLRVKPTAAGKNVTCPKCQHSVPVPASPLAFTAPNDAVDGPPVPAPRPVTAAQPNAARASVGSPQTVQAGAVLTAPTPTNVPSPAPASEDRDEITKVTPLGTDSDGEQAPAGDAPKSVRLDVLVRDQEVVAELLKHEPGEARNTFALSALRIGVLALRQASGIVDSGVLKHEGEKLLASVGELLTVNSTHFHEVLSASLKRYFDPADGDLPQRLDRLLKKDGDLQSLLAKHLDGDESTIARTLAKHVGEQSPLFRLLSPDQTDGVLATMSQVIEEALKGQREQIVKQFSLDDKESALSRLITEISGANGRLREDLSTDLKKLEDEFSLDNEDGALCRLVDRVDKAQQSIADQFSKDNEESALNRMSKLIETANDSIKASLTLDDDKSPLSRLRKELLNVIADMGKSNNDFQKDVLTTLETFKARKEEMDRSTRHGGEFEEAAGKMIQDDAQRRGDTYESTGSKTGIKKNCKVGDHVVTLGPDSAAPGVRIVVEAKEDKSYDLVKARAEMEEARVNRDAQAGIFVFSKTTAPEGLEPFARHGSDIVVIWDRDDPATDIYLTVGMSLARALVIREKVAKAKSATGLLKVKEAVATMMKDIERLENITTWAGTIQNNTQKILKQVELLRKNLEAQTEELTEYIGEVGQEESSPSEIA